jgi:hypothetical protein
VPERFADPVTSHAQPAPPARLAQAAMAAALAVAAAVLGPFLARSGLVPSGVGEGIFRGAVPLALAAVLLAILAMRRSRRRFGGLVVIGVAVAAAALPIRIWVAARSAPRIHDVTTDLDNPPRYVAVARLRVSPANSIDYGGEPLAEQQRASYSDLRPLIVHAPPPRVLAMAADTARAEGWTVLAQDIGFGDLGRLEATDTSFLFGRLDDVVVRIVPHAAGSRVDVRSSAREGGADEGRNARRVRRFLAFLAERAAAEPAGAPR